MKLTYFDNIKHQLFNKIKEALSREKKEKWANAKAIFSLSRTSETD